MLYHASPIGGITTLEAHVSNHGKPLIYLSSRRENVLVYLSNAVEKHCRETGFVWDGPWMKWASYGFTKDGILQLEEYYPNATHETYHGVSGYVYEVAVHEGAEPQADIPCAFTSEKPLPVAACTFIPDAYEALLSAEASGLLRIKRYEEISENTLRWLEKVIPAEYARAENHPEYRRFLQSKFSFLNPG